MSIVFRLPLMFLIISLLLNALTVKAETQPFSEAQLDQMMAPVALYPDALLAQILMACTYPADVAEAVAWSKNNSNLKGDQAVQAVQNKPWDPSVMSLTAFPQVLDMMGNQPDWVQNVGDAFLADSNAVMDSVQKLRAKAHEAGNLKTTEQQKVIVQQQPSETIIVIEQANPKVVYVPVYNPTVVYGTWWWPHYRPWYYYPPPHYAYGSALMHGVAFGIGVGITYALWSDFHWGHGHRHGHHNIDININKYNNININKINSNRNDIRWNHNPSHRRAVPYRDAKTRNQYTQRNTGAAQRMDYRGRDLQREQARATLNQRAVNPSEGRQQLQGRSGNSMRRTIGDTSTIKPSNHSGNRTIGSTRHDFNRSFGHQDNALRGAGNTRQTQQNIQRGSRSISTMQRSHPSHSGGSGGFRGHGGGPRR